MPGHYPSAHPVRVGDACGMLFFSIKLSTGGQFWPCEAAERQVSNVLWHQFNYDMGLVRCDAWNYLLLWYIKSIRYTYDH